MRCQIPRFFGLILGFLDKNVPKGGNDSGGGNDSVLYGMMNSDNQEYIEAQVNLVREKTMEFSEDNRNTQKF